MKGADAEERALRHLLAQGHRVLARNYRVKGGELDLVTRDGDTVVFTEVKHRSRPTHGDPLESVTPRKVARLRRAAQLYLLREFGTEELPCRFDVIAISGSAAAGALCHVQNALG